VALCWYALYTKSRHENVVRDQLGKKRLEVFLPKVTMPSRRKDRKKMIRVPLFPGYLFVRTDLDTQGHVEILKIPGAVSLVGNTNGPVMVPDEDIESLRILIQSPEVVTGTTLVTGDKVLVVSGPFAGLRGVFTRYKGADRVIVNVDALGQFAGIEIDGSQVKKIF